MAKKTMVVNAVTQMLGIISLLTSLLGYTHFHMSLIFVFECICDMFTLLRIIDIIRSLLY